MSTYLVRDGQTVSDVVMATYGDLSYVYKFLLDNPIINGINDDLSQHHSLEVVYDEILSDRPVNIESSFSGISTKETYKSRSGQNIYDICLQVYGTLENLFKLMQESEYYDLETLPTSGSYFYYDPTEKISQKFDEMLLRTGIHINTADQMEAGCLGCSFDESFDYSFEVCEC